MPDLTTAMRFHKDMMTIEARFIKASLGLYAAFRRDALSIIDQVGLTSPDLAQLIRNRLNVFANQIRELALEYVEPLGRVSDDYARRSFQRLRIVAPELPTFADLQAASQTDRQQVLAEFLATTANFVEVINSRFVVAIDEARQSEDDPQAVRRLLSPEPVDGRASVYRHGENTIQYEGQRKIWTVGLGLAAVYSVVANRESPVKLQKQAVAVIDGNTTPCCLDIHGQIKDIDEPFEFGDSPCGGGRKQHPPFPNHPCRTVEAPYLPALERLGITTAEMRTQALAERANR